MNPLNDFIVDKYREKRLAETEGHMEKEIEDKQKPVTVRVHTDDLKTIDNMAGYLGVSRQQIIQNMIEGGITTALNALAFASLQSKDLLPEMETYGNQEAYDRQVQELIDDERSNFIKVLCS